LKFIAKFDLSCVKDDVVVTEGAAEPNNPMILEKVKEKAPRLDQDLVVTDAPKNRVNFVYKKSLEDLRSEFAFSKDISQYASCAEDNPGFLEKVDTTETAYGWGEDTKSLNPAIFLF
jgi:hypothetical protein